NIMYNAHLYVSYVRKKQKTTGTFCLAVQRVDKVGQRQKEQQQVILLSWYGPFGITEITGFGIMKKVVHTSWVGKHFKIGMSGSWHKASTKILRAMNEYSSNNHGRRRGMDG
ncbi:hypothetical protein A2U01_0045919, partial [Trifolium medium]|nr:hypothetical protein [Trifolium medium]